MYPKLKRELQRPLVSTSDNLPTEINAHGSWVSLDRVVSRDTGDIMYVHVDDHVISDRCVQSGDMLVVHQVEPQPGQLVLGVARGRYTIKPFNGPEIRRQLRIVRPNEPEPVGDFDTIGVITHILKKLLCILFIIYVSSETVELLYFAL